MPIFFVWVYVACLVVLFGAQISYNLSVFRMEDIGKYNFEYQRNFFDAYQIIGELWLAQRVRCRKIGDAVKKSGVRISYASTNTIFDFLEVGENGAQRDSLSVWRLTMDLGESTLMDFYKILPCKLPANTGRPANKRQKSSQGVLADSDASLAVSLAIPASKALKYSTVKSQ